MSISKFWKEAIGYRLGGGHVADHASLKKQNGDPIVMNQTASQKYRFFFPCQQQAGTYGLIDASGNYSDAVYNQLGVGVQAETAYWVNKGYATVGGGGNSGLGVPVSFQDVCLGTSISAMDVWDHMQAKVLPQSLLHVRATSNKKAIDLSRNSVPVSLNGAGITIVQV